MEPAITALNVIKLLSFVVGLVPDPQAETGPLWVWAMGKAPVHQDISEAEACAKAEHKAKTAALKEYSGEYISSQSFMACSERDDRAGCLSSIMTWAMTGGMITDIRNKMVKVSTALDQTRVCRVSLEAAIAERKDDPDFDLDVTLSDSILREGDAIKLTVTTTQPMYVNVFDSRVDKSYLIYPNAYEPDNHITTPMVIPSTNRYSLNAEYPKEAKSDVVHKMLHIVATRKKIRFLPAYRGYQLEKKMLEIVPTDVRYIQRGYRIIR